MSCPGSFSGERWACFSKEQSSTSNWVFLSVTLNKHYAILQEIKKIKPIKNNTTSAGASKCERKPA